MMETPSIELNATQLKVLRILDLARCRPRTLEQLTSATGLGRHTVAGALSSLSSRGLVCASKDRWWFDSSPAGWMIEDAGVQLLAEHRKADHTLRRRLGDGADSRAITALLAGVR